MAPLHTTTHPVIFISSVRPESQCKYISGIVTSFSRYSVKLPETKTDRTQELGEVRKNEEEYPGCDLYFYACALIHIFFRVCKFL